MTATSKMAMVANVPLKGSLSPPFIVTRRDGVHAQGNVEVVIFPRIAGVQWSSTVESTLWGMASGVTVVLDIVIGLAKIAPASCQPQQAAWSSLWGVQSSRCGVVVSVGPASQGFAYIRAPVVTGHVAIPDPPGRSAGVCTKEVRESRGCPGPLEGEVRASDC